MFFRFELLDVGHDFLWSLLFEDRQLQNHSREIVCREPVAGDLRFKSIPFEKRSSTMSEGRH